MTLAAFAKNLPKPPGRTLTLEPSVFADEWAGKPRDTVCVGLRLMSESDKTIARRDSEALALELHPKGGINAVDSYNDALLRHCVAFGICDPNDVSKPWAGMELPEAEVRIALTSRGARLIYEAIERYEIESSPLNAELDDGDEMDELIGALERGALSLIEPARAGLARRLLRYALLEMRTAATREG